MKFNMEINPDKGGYYTRAEILMLVERDGHCPGPISEAIKNHEIPQIRSSNKKKARAKLRMEDVKDWMKKNCNIK